MPKSVREQNAPWYADVESKTIDFIPGEPQHMFGSRFFTLLLIATPMFPADPVDFALWKRSELTKREQNLAKNVRPDHSARETLADYKTHRFRMLYRDADGYPE